MGHELVFDLPDAAVVSHELTKQPLTPVAHHCCVKRSFDALLQGLTLSECLVILHPEVVVLLDNLELQGYLSDLIAQLVLHDLEVLLKGHCKPLQPLEAVALVFEDV